MSKVHFDENELMIMAMFEQDTAENTKKELEEVLPYVVHQRNLFFYQS